MSGTYGPCPKCTSSDGFFSTDHNGLSYCFVCGYWERSDNYKEEEQIRGPIGDIRSAYEQLTRYYQTRLTKEHRHYLHTRGITDESIERFRIGYCPDDQPSFYKNEIMLEAGVVDRSFIPTLANRIIFPYIYKGTVYDLRGRSLDKDESIRYKGPHGKRYYRGADYLYNAEDSKYPHCLVEGEIKTIVVTQQGVRACGIPGITITYDTYKPAKYFITYDAEGDLSKQRVVNEAIMKASLFGTDPYVLTLPLLGEDKMGADDLIIKAGKEVFMYYKAHALPYNVWINIMRDTL